MDLIKWISSLKSQDQVSFCAAVNVFGNSTDTSRSKTLTWTGDRWVKVWIGSRSNRSCTNNQRIQMDTVPKGHPCEVKKEWGMNTLNTHRWQWQWLCLALFWHPFGTFTCKSPKLAGSSRRGMPSPRILTTCPSDSRRWNGGSLWRVCLEVLGDICLLHFHGMSCWFLDQISRTLWSDSMIRTNDIQWLYTDEVLTSSWCKLEHCTDHPPHFATVWSPSPSKWVIVRDQPRRDSRKLMVNSLANIHSWLPNSASRCPSVRHVNIINILLEG